jgi:trimeric autotransporter adhesin
MAAGTARSATEPPATARRSTGSAGFEWTVRDSGATAVTSRAARSGLSTATSAISSASTSAISSAATSAISSAATSAAVGTSAISSAATLPASPASTSRSRQPANSASSLAETSAITPRPNWAILPLIVRSVSMATRVAPSPASVRVAVTVAEAFPWPRVSRPSALRTILRPTSSTSAKRTAPLYWAVMAPSFTLTMPRYSSPATSWSSAPGMHGAIRSTSSRTFHASSAGRLTVKLFSMRMVASYPTRSMAAR